jgi:thiosulfate/3-mercaptopyruvate sulfurtransferase
MGGWCPGTAAAGLAQGKIDALIFLIGAVLGSILFNEVYALVKPLSEWGSSGVLFVYDSLRMTQGAFLVTFTIVGILCFALCEFVERRHADLAPIPNPTLKAVSLCLVILAVALSLTASPGPSVPAALVSSVAESQLLQAVDEAQDHMAPETLADRLMARDKTLLLVDVRPQGEYAQGHIPGAVNIAMADLHTTLAPYRNAGTIVLYSNGMTHPAQARDSLARAGFNNVFILTDGLIGFQQQCLKPVSLRSEPLSPSQAAAVNQWRAFFNGPQKQPVQVAASSVTETVTLPGALVETGWLQDHLTSPNVKVIDLRAQPVYSTSHIPGSLALGTENFRTHVLGLGSMLSPVDLLARQVSLMGIDTKDLLVLVPTDAIRDATLVGLALERIGHTGYAILNGGFEQWAANQRPVNADLPDVTLSQYPVRAGADRFTVTAATVLEAVRLKTAVIIDVRPVEYFQGVKSDEARAGHIPGALNRAYTEDIQKTGTVTTFKPTPDLTKAYTRLIPTVTTRVIVHCRTGHQASQTVFVLKHLLGYKNVQWYDGGWTEWAANKALPIESDAARQP